MTCTFFGHRDAPPVFPEGIELVPKRFAISFRNRFMVEQSDTVIAYVVSPCGGAAKFTDLALKKEKPSSISRRNPAQKNKGISLSEKRNIPLY